MFETKPLTVDEIQAIRDRYISENDTKWLLLSAKEAEKLFAMIDAIEWIARHPEGDEEPAEGSSRRAGWEMSQRARKALGEKGDGK